MTQFLSYVIAKHFANPHYKDLSFLIQWAFPEFSVAKV